MDDPRRQPGPGYSKHHLQVSFLQLSEHHLRAGSVAPISYAADVCPIHLRAYLTGWVNCCNTLGGLLAQAVLVGTEGMGNKQIAYRLPWATPWIWPIPLFIAMYLAPESPWWLIRHQEIEKATQAVRRLAPAWDQTQADETVAMMVRTNQEEEQFNNTTKPATWKEMFTGVDRRRTLTGMMILTWAPPLSLCTKLTLSLVHNG